MHVKVIMYFQYWFLEYWVKLSILLKLNFIKLILLKLKFYLFFSFCLMCLLENFELHM